MIRLLVAALAVTVAGWGPPGYFPEAGARWSCPKCGTYVRAWTWRSAHCPDDGWFLTGACQYGCNETAFRFAVDDWEWECSDRHYFAGASCPDCEYWAAEERSGGELVCGGPEMHSFYLHKRHQVCPHCESGFVLSSVLRSEAACEACDQPQPRR
jgi:hypothetical protein